MEPKTLLDTDVLSGLMRKTPTALNRARSYSSDQLIPDADILIAATAIENALVLATNNEGDFGRIAGLRIDNWLAPT